MDIIYGINPLTEALRIDPCRVMSIVAAKGLAKETLQAVLALAAIRKIPVSYREKRELDKLSGRKLHQGIIGFCPSFVYADLDQILKHRHPALPFHLVLLLDGITDPQNLGALIRTAHCYGVNGVLIPERRAAAVTAAVIKASAGAALQTPIARVANLSRAIDELKTRGFWIYGADAHTGRDVHGAAYEGHIGLVMGSEDRGMRPLVRRQCDFLLTIPIIGKIDSLNVSVAAGIFLNDIVRKRIHVEGVE
jgi:23S rRNA (guanosine2251-2'-O)-methyltransferase